MILLSFGTRPEWIKIKPLLDQMDGNIPYRLLFTGQHVDLLSKVGKDKDLVKLEIKDGPNRLDKPYLVLPTFIFAQPQCRETF